MKFKLISLLVLLFIHSICLSYNSNLQLVFTIDVNLQKTEKISFLLQKQPIHNVKHLIDYISFKRQRILTTSNTQSHQNIQSRPSTLTTATQVSNISMDFMIAVQIFNCKIAYIEYFE